jgi:glyoxylase-like metal-dependent hydrolase (beta-lactamase superfamily II)
LWRIAAFRKVRPLMLIRIFALAAICHGALACAASQVAPGIHLIEGEATPNRQPDGNSIVITAPKGLIVFDTGRHKDHVGGNPLLRAAFPESQIYASSAIDAARRGFLADYRTQLVSRLAATKEPEAGDAMRAEIALIDKGAALGPTDVVSKSGPVTIAGRELRLYIESHAVTAGDVWVFDPETHVLLAGDLVTLPAPFFESACPARWRSALSRLEKEHFDWLVPGHGAPMHKREFTVYRKAFGNLLDCAAGNDKKFVCVDRWIDDASVLIPSKDVSYARTLIGYYVDNYLRQPTERVRSFCTAP